MPLIFSPIGILLFLLTWMGGAAALRYFEVGHFVSMHFMVALPIALVVLLFLGLFLQMGYEVKTWDVAIKWRVAELLHKEFRIVEESFVDGNGEQRCQLIDQERTMWPYGFGIWWEMYRREKKAWPIEDAFVMDEFFSKCLPKEVASRKQDAVDEVRKLREHLGGKKVCKVVAKN